MKSSESLPVQIRLSAANQKDPDTMPHYVF